MPAGSLADPDAQFSRIRFFRWKTHRIAQVFTRSIRPLSLPVAVLFTPLDALRHRLKGKPLKISPSSPQAAPHPCGSPAPTLAAEMTNGSFMSPSEPRNPQNAVVRSTLHFSLTKRPPNAPLRPSPHQTRSQTHRQPHPNHHLRRHPIHLPLHLPPLRRRNVRQPRLPLLPNHRHRRHDQLLPFLQKKRRLPHAPTPRSTTCAVLLWRELRFHRRESQTNQPTAAPARTPHRKWILVIVMCRAI